MKPLPNDTQRGKRIIKKLGTYGLFYNYEITIGTYPLIYCRVNFQPNRRDMKQIANDRGMVDS